MILRLAIRELRHSGAKLRLVALILCIGFIGPLITSALKASVAEYLESSSRRILSADIAVSSLRAFLPKEIDWLKSHLGASRIEAETEFVTMARGRGVATLVEIKGVDSGFPIYGRFDLKGETAPRASAAELNREEPMAWADPEALAQLGLTVGDRVGVGQVEFRIAGALQSAPGVGRTSGFAPRLYVGRKFIADTKLTQYGAQVFHRVYLRLPPALDAEKATERIKGALRDPEIFVRTPDDSIRSFERFFKFFNLYLVSIAMIVFVLSWIAAFYILQIFLQERLKNAAVFMINGGTRWAAGLLYSLQVVLVMAGAFIASALVVKALVVTANVVFAARFPEHFTMLLPWHEVLVLATVAGVSALAFNGPFFVRLYFLRLQTLLGESVLGVERVPRSTIALSYGPLVVLFLLLAAWLMDSFLGSLRLAGGMLGAAAIGWFLGRILFRSFFTSMRSRPGLLRLVATSLSRSRFGMNLCFLALVLVAVALNLVPHLLKSVVSEVQPLQGKEIPSLFLFNIPESGLESVQTFARERDIELRFLSPMVLGRLMKVNDGESDDRFQRFPVRLSYREKRIPSERLVEGREFSGRFDPARDKEAEISVEIEFAKRNQFRIGDVIEFDVQSVPVRARIVNLRHVQWTTFNPNFFIMFQPGVLDDAPKTYIANLHMASADGAKVRAQYELTKSFPDISIIDIGRTIEHVLEIVREVIGPVQAAALVAVIMSFLVLVGIIVHNLRLRDGEIDVEKLLGADGPLIRRLLVGEYAVTASFAWLTGALAALVLAWVVLRQVMDIPLRISWDAVAVSALITIVSTVAIAFSSSTRVLNLRGASRKL